MGDHMMRITHYIEGIDTKPGANLVFDHEQIAFRPCAVIRAEVGDFGWIAVEPSSDPGVLHLYRTSKIVSITHDGDSMVIETKNTYYKLRRIKSGKMCATKFSTEGLGETK